MSMLFLFNVQISVFIVNWLAWSMVLAAFTMRIQSKHLEIIFFGLAPTKVSLRAQAQPLQSASIAHIQAFVRDFNIYYTIGIDRKIMNINVVRAYLNI